MKWPGFKRAEKTAQATFHAVEVVPMGTACRAAKLMTGTRYLSSGIPPPIPLPDCDRRNQCQCRYRHHADRRVELRRDSDHAWAAQTTWSGGIERRQKRGRRATDEMLCRCGQVTVDQRTNAFLSAQQLRFARARA
jgi:hypothetical protein